MKHPSHISVTSVYCHIKSDVVFSDNFSSFASAIRTLRLLCRCGRGGSHREEGEKVSPFYNIRKLRSQGRGRSENKHHRTLQNEFYKNHRMFLHSQTVQHHPCSPTYRAGRFRFLRASIGKGISSGDWGRVPLRQLTAIAGDGHVLVVPQAPYCRLVPEFPPTHVTLMSGNPCVCLLAEGGLFDVHVPSIAFVPTESNVFMWTQYLFMLLLACNVPTFLYYTRMLDDMVKLRTEKAQHRRWKAAALVCQKELSTWIRTALDDRATTDLSNEK